MNDIDTLEMYASMQVEATAEDGDLEDVRSGPHIGSRGGALSPSPQEQRENTRPGFTPGIILQATVQDFIRDNGIVGAGAHALFNSPTEVQ